MCLPRCPPLFTCTGRLPPSEGTFEGWDLVTTLHKTVAKCVAYVVNVQLAVTVFKAGRKDSGNGIVFQIGFHFIERSVNIMMYMYRI